MAPKRSKNQIRREKAKLRKVQDKNDSSPLSSALNTAKSERKSDEPSSIDTLTQQTQPLNNGDGADDKLAKESEKDTHTPRANIKQTQSSVENGNSSDIPNLTGQFQHVFAKFEQPSKSSSQSLIPQSLATEHLESSDEESLSEEVEKPISKRQRRKLNKVSIAELKAYSNRPNSVAWYDADAPDPYMCIAFKTSFNSIDVPSHWLQKKDYLSGKKGYEVPPFKLPKFIQDTGIAEMRNYDPESLKKEQRDRVQPKMGKLDIDYQKLHDAFFKYQTKPRYLKFGELYWEGREKADQHRETVMHMRPGVVSKRLREAVGLSGNDLDVIPPWVTLMNLIGKPPAYKHCIIPGVDVVYNNGGYRTSESSDFNFQDEAAWGAFEKVVESDYDDSESEEEADSNDDDEISSEKSVEEEPDVEEPEKVDITEFSKYKTNASDNSSKDTSGSLYKVLKEKAVSDSKGEDKKTGYEITTADDTSPMQTKTMKDDKKEDVEDFEF
ncbi:hypothetical protein C7M61_000785 [Candidozyma pseudohaemuli]|uniref:PSP proline-rich domain-containing protein n=1 Tax=Candidozyma pseudohaemuli TaxID=418784 RepID=A0A2P7YYS5_9ASCO|nr:hypothetical protein C7M61_000785 [[Candida] pseudohaemulonii]PSK41113.1 hypothetical protein C7M61_000785 [[Candida] pseudohaemulonii]